MTDYEISCFIMCDIKIYENKPTPAISTNISAVEQPKNSIQNSPFLHASTSCSHDSDIWGIFTSYPFCFSSGLLVHLRLSHC